MAPVRHLDALGSEALEAALVENAPTAWEEGASYFQGRVLEMSQILGRAAPAHRGKSAESAWHGVCKKRKYVRNLTGS
jgi:hypothetical protein